MREAGGGRGRASPAAASAGLGQKRPRAALLCRGVDGSCRGAALGEAVVLPGALRAPPEQRVRQPCALSHRLRGCRACREVRGGSLSLGAENEMVMFGFWSGSAAEQRPRHPRSSAGRRCCLLGTAPGYTNTAWCLLKKLVQEVRTD